MGELNGEIMGALNDEIIMGEIMGELIHDGINKWQN